MLRTDLAVLYLRDVKGFEEPELLEYGVDSWKRRGFEVRILRPTDAEKHPLCGLLRDNVSINYGQKPSRHGINLAAFERWCAFSVAAGTDGALLMEYDVINYRFSPADLATLLEKHTASNMLCLAKPGFGWDESQKIHPPVPCYGTREQIDRFVEFCTFYDHESMDEMEWRGRHGHSPLDMQVDDQLLFSLRVPDLHTDRAITPLYGPTSGWHRAPLVHFPHYQVSGDYDVHRVDKIKIARPL